LYNTDLRFVDIELQILVATTYYQRLSLSLKTQYRIAREDASSVAFIE